MKHSRNGYSCKVCGSNFDRLVNISRHIRTQHFLERPYHCHKCDERFFDNSQFTAHKKTCESSVGDTPLVSASVSTSSALSNKSAYLLGSKSLVKSSPASQANKIDTQSQDNTTQSESDGILTPEQIEKADQQLGKFLL